MSRINFTVETQYSSLLPTFRIWTGDHTGGNYNIKGFHPSTLATMVGHGPEYPQQERFDVRFLINKKRANASFVVNTKKHLPALSWSTDKGLAPLPLGLGSLGSVLLGSGSKSKDLTGEDDTGSARPRPRREREQERGRESRDRHRHSLDEKRPPKALEFRRDDQRRSLDTRRDRADNKRHRESNLKPLRIKHFDPNTSSSSSSSSSSSRHSSSRHADSRRDSEGSESGHRNTRRRRSRSRS